MTITSVTVLNDFSIPITAPIATSVFVPLNGRAIRVVESSGATTCDVSKVTGSILRRGFDSAGAPTTYTDPVNFSMRIRRPFNNTGQFSSDDVPGTFDIAPDVTIFVNDQVTINFAAGFVTGSPATTISSASVIRQDNRPYRQPVSRPISRAYRVYRGATNAFEVAAVGDSPRNKSLVVAVRAFIIDKNGLKGPVGTSASMVVALDAPAGGPSGIAGLCYRMNLSTTGLADGVGQVVYQVIPWVGDTIADSRTFGEVWPTLSAPKSLPCTVDNANNYTAIYALVSQAKTGLAGTSTAGLCTTMAGAIAAATPYVSEAACLAAVKLANNAGSGAPVTILGDAGTGTRTFSRATPHNDCDAAVIVAIPVAGSAAQFGVSETGSYSTGTSWFSQTTYPIVNVPVTITSPTGQWDDAVRYTSGAASGVVAANRLVGRMVDWVGITLDSSFQAASSANNIIADYGATGAPGALPTAATCIVPNYINCRARGNLAGGSANGMMVRTGYPSWYGCSWHGDGSSSSVGVSSGFFAGGINYIGSEFGGCVNLVPPSVAGVILINMAAVSQAFGTPQPTINDVLWGGLAVHSNAGTVSVGPAALRPLRGFASYSIIVRSTNSLSSPIYRVNGDGNLIEIENYYSICRTTAGQRVNEEYQDQGYIPLTKDSVHYYEADEQINHKADTFNAPEGPGTAAQYYSGASSYYKGAMLTDMPGLSAISGDGTTVTATLVAAPPSGVVAGTQIQLTGFPSASTAYNGVYTLVSVSGTTLTWAGTATAAAVLTAVFLTAAGAGLYQANRRIPIVGQLDRTTVTAGGSGYTYATVALSGGGATRQATVNAVLRAGVLAGFYTVDPGVGYTSAPTVTITGDGTGATATAVALLSALVLTNGAYFTDITALTGSNQFNTPYGQQPYRTGSWGTRFFMDSFGNFARHSFNDNAVYGSVNNTFGETGPGNNFYGRGGKLLAYTSGQGWYKRNTGWASAESAQGDPSGTNVTVVNAATVQQGINPANDLGSFVPLSIAAGDSVDSPLVNAIAAGYAPLPQDIYGTPYRNDGTDSAGVANTLVGALPPFVGTRLLLTNVGG